MIRRSRRRASSTAWPKGSSEPTGAGRALWYPVKDRKAVAAFRKALKETSVPKLLDIGLEIRPPSADPSLDGSGMVVVNPPFTLEGELRTLLPVLHRLLTVEKPAHWTLEWLAGE